MKRQYRICTIRGELRDPTDRGTESLTDAIKKAEALVHGGHFYPGVSIWEWTGGHLAAIITPEKTELIQHD